MGEGAEEGEKHAGTLTGGASADGDAPAAQSAPCRLKVAALVENRGPETPMQRVEGGIRAESEWPEAGKGSGEKAVAAPGNARHETRPSTHAGGGRALREGGWCGPHGLCKREPATITPASQRGRGVEGGAPGGGASRTGGWSGPHRPYKRGPAASTPISHPASQPAGQRGGAAPGRVGEEEGQKGGQGECAIRGGRGVCGGAAEAGRRAEKDDGWLLELLATYGAR